MAVPLLDLSSYIHESRIHFFQDPVEKQGALQALATLAGEDETVTDKEAFCQAIFEREEVSSTGIGCGVAVPHAKIDSNKGFSITVGICAPGIDYAASDGEPVHVLFMIAATDQQRKAYLQLLATVAHMLKKESVYKALCEATDAACVIDILSQSH